MRAQQIVEALLSGAVENRARVAIIDITGVRSLNVYGVQTLVRAAQGLRLLGVAAVLTGLRPSIAREMVTIGADLTCLLTRSTFQEGILYALDVASQSKKSSKSRTS